MKSPQHTVKHPTGISCRTLNACNQSTHTQALLQKLQALILSAILFVLCSPQGLAIPNYSVLHSFGENTSGFGGANPQGTLIQASDGKFYGTTNKGGISFFDSNGNFIPSNGTIFSLDTSVSPPVYNILFNFYSDRVNLTLPNGSYPTASLLQARNGKLYGTAQSGGSFGNGTIFELDITAPTPIFRVLRHLSFADGIMPGSPLIQGSDAKLYGATIAGGIGFGTVFSLDISGADPVFTVLHSFDGIEGNFPQGRLVQPTNSTSVCGITTYGGNSNLGTIYCINTLGIPKLTTLYEFGSLLDGVYPQAGLTEGSDGKLYGTTTNGLQYGTIFRLETDTTPATMTVLHAFPAITNGSDYLDGGVPLAELIQGRDRKLYGTTATGGSNGGVIGGNTGGSGTIYQLDISGTTPIFNVLHRFENSTSSTYTNLTGWQPLGGLTQGNDGQLYGTTWSGGGEFNFGVIYQLSLKNPTRTTLTASPNPATFGQLVTLAATVTGNSPTGTVTFMEGTTPLGTPAVELGTAAVSNGVATLPLSNYAVGIHGLYANYSGDVDDGVSTSLALAVTVNPNTIPTAVNDAYTLVHNGLTPVSVAAPGVLGNDSDADGQAVHVVGATGATPRVIPLATSGGTVNLFADGHFTYTPPTAAFAGKRSFTYQVSDGVDNSNPATVTLTIRRGVPNAVNDTATTPQGQAVTINVLANDTEAGAAINPSTVKIVTSPANGATSVNANGSV